MMKALPFTALLSLALVAACVEPPKNPMEERARLAAAAEFSARNCAGYMGGYAGVQQAKRDADVNLVAARQLGATEADIEKARADVRTAFDATTMFRDRQQACNQLIGQLAWHSS